jgi:uncharacterized membrane protein YdjX (TVP38/TMEM64 family)
MIMQKNRILLLVLIISAIVAIRFSSLGNILTFENLKHQRESLALIVRENYLSSSLLYIVVYILSTAFSIPGAVILTLAGGFLFGVTIGTLYVDVGATLGAAGAFLSARYLLGERLQHKYDQQLKRFNAEMDRNGMNYLLTLRLIPLFPFFLINFLSGLTQIPLRTFIWTTAVGIIPGTAVFAFTGQQLALIDSPKDILTGKILMVFIVLAVFALIPVFWKRRRHTKL